MDLQQLENILNLDFVKTHTVPSDYAKSINVTISGSKQKKQILEKSLKKLHLKLNRSADYFSRIASNKNLYEIDAVDGIGNETIVQYCIKHAQKAKNSYR